MNSHISKTEFSTQQYCKASSVILDLYSVNVKFFFFFNFHGFVGVEGGGGGHTSSQRLLHTYTGVETAAVEVGNPPALTSEITCFFGRVCKC